MTTTGSFSHPPGRIAMLMNVTQAGLDGTVVRWEVLKGLLGEGPLPKHFHMGHPTGPPGRDCELRRNSLPEKPTERPSPQVPGSGYCLGKVLPCRFW
jgi:hypothetical protein